MMRRAIFVLALSLCVSTARAAEVIATAADWSVFANAAVQTGFADPASRQPISQGSLPDGGSFFYNAVGVVAVPTGKQTTCEGLSGASVACPEMQTLPGVWVRVRFNGEASNLPTLIETWRKLGITIYLRTKIGGVECWSADGATCGPDYLDLIGVIAAAPRYTTRG